MVVPDFQAFPTPMEAKAPPSLNYESLLFMSYTYSLRNTLAKISTLLNNGQASSWANKAQQIQDKVTSYLWVADKHAAYDRDRNNNILNCMYHGNIQAMWHGLFTQQQADYFIKYNLLNPNKFWTTYPLPSIAVDDPLFQNISNNNWGGQPQGLTYQRVIRALENYGHFAELTLIGQKLINKCGTSLQFTQQMDPYTGAQNGGNGYGPCILANLEFINRLFGVHIEGESVYWSGLDRGSNYVHYYRTWNNNVYYDDIYNGTFIAKVNDVVKFSCTTGVRRYH